MDGFDQAVPEDWGCYGEGSVIPGPVLGSEWWREVICISGTEKTGWSVAVMQGGKTAQTENTHLHTNNLTCHSVLVDQGDKSSRSQITQSAHHCGFHLIIVIIIIIIIILLLS